MQRFKALSFSDKWRVSRSIYRGEAPEDPLLAAAAVELAEEYQRRGHMRLYRRVAIALIILMVLSTIYAIVGGEALQAALWGLTAVLGIAHLMLNPATQPESVARSLEASRRVAGPSG